MQQYREKCIVKNVRGKNGNIPRESLKSPIFATCFDNSRSMMKYCWLFFVLIIMAASSCSVPKDVTYLQGLDSLTPEQKEMMNRSYESRICPDDQLSITVTASDPTVTTPFNPPVYSYAGAGEQATISSPAMYTYLVDADGYIGPSFLKDGMLWAHSVYFRALIAEYEATGDGRILEALKNHYIRADLKERIKSRTRSLSIIRLPVLLCASAAQESLKASGPNSTHTLPAGYFCILPRSGAPAQKCTRYPRYPC